MSTPGVGMMVSIINADRSPSRFENYANKVVSLVEAIPVVPTSSSWDLGRDGRSVGEVVIFVCASLESRPDAKALRDIKRLTSKASSTIRKIYFCSSQSLSEHAAEKIKSAIRGELSTSVEVDVLGADHLVALDVSTTSTAGGSPEIIRFYKAEWDEVSRLFQPGTSVSPSEDALRLALLAMGPDDSLAIRRKFYTALILDSLSKEKAKRKNKTELARSVSQRLRMSKSLGSEVLAPFLSSLIADELVVDEDGFMLTAKGERLAEEQRQAAATNLLSGKDAIRSHLEDLLAFKINVDQFNELWASVEDRLADLLYRRGESIIASVSALLNKEPERLLNDEEYRALLDALGSGAAHAWPDTNTKAAVGQAVKDMLTEGVGPASDWLVRICSSYVALCSVGLEAQSSNIVERVLKQTEVVLDTDVALCLLCPGETLHRDVTSAYRQWVAIGGRVLLARPVAQEVAHHAWIADNDFDAVASFLPGSVQEGLRIVKNAFVRGFAKLVREGKANKQQWRSYISQYRGVSQDDFFPVQTLLKREYGFAELPPVAHDSVAMGQEVYSSLVARIDDQFFQGRMSERDRKIRTDKAKRDASLIAALATRRESLAATDFGSCCLVSSSGRLAEFPRELPGYSNATPWVISPGAWICLISLMPGARVGLSEMRSFLFEDRFRYKAYGLEEIVLRTIKGASDVRMGWAHRVTLFENVRRAVFSTANALGVSERKIEGMIANSAESEENKNIASQVLAKALDEMSIEPKLEKSLRERIRELEEENKKLREGKK